MRTGRSQDMTNSVLPLETASLSRAFHPMQIASPQPSEHLGQSTICYIEVQCFSACLLCKRQYPAVLKHFSCLQKTLGTLQTSTRDGEGGREVNSLRLHIETMFGNVAFERLITPPI